MQQHQQQMGQYIKKILESRTTILILSNNEIKDMKIVKSLKYFGLSLKGVSETIQNEAKEKKGGFPSVLFDTLDELDVY